MPFAIKRNLGSRSVKVIVASAISIVSIMIAAHAYRMYVIPSIGPQVSISSYPLKLTMSLGKTDFVSGENVSMCFTLTNLSNDSVTIVYPAIMGDSGSELPRGKACHYLVFSYVVSDENGIKVFSLGEHKASLNAVWSLTLSPFEEVSQTVTWNQKLDYPDYLNIPSGVYDIRGVIPALGRVRINGGPLITVETPAIAFVVK